ncbi:hypothetical protein ACFL1T_01905 [Chlamydiota bacterium]
MKDTPLYEEAQRLYEKENYCEALQLLRSYLSVYPTDREALFIAQTIFCILMVKNPSQAIPDELLGDPVFDSVFSECELCKQFWPINPLLEKGEQVRVINPIGGFCEYCKSVFCNKCAVKGETLLCPQCKNNLEQIIRPQGRKTKERASSVTTSIKKIFILREPPIPEDKELYKKLVLDSLYPGALEDGVPITLIICPYKNDQYYILMQARRAEKSANILQYDLKIQSFQDKHGKRGFLLKCY